MWDVFLPPLFMAGGFRDPYYIKNLYCKISELHPSDIKLTSSYNVVLVQTNNDYYKIPLTQDAKDRIAHEFNNWWNLSKDEQVKRFLVQHLELVKSDNFIMLKVEKKEILSSIPDKIKAAEYLLEEMSATATLGQVFATEDLQRGLNFLETNSSSQIFRLFSSKYDLFLKETIRNGLTHGDFHGRNMLKTNRNEYIMIDLDRLSLNGIQALDAVHFIIDTEVRRKKVPWQVQLLHYHIGCWAVEEEYKRLFNTYVDIDRNLLTYIYFLDRTGKEYTNESARSRYWFGNMVRFLSNFTGENIDSEGYTC
jgi:hypothetical protein